MTSIGSPPPVRVPAALASSMPGAAWRAWTAGLPALAEAYLARWDLRPDGPPRHGALALVLPVVRRDGTQAVLKLQPVDDETRGEPVALRSWGSSHAVALLDHDPESGTMLLERLDADRSLAAVPDPTEALQRLAELLAGLVAAPAPAGLPLLADIAGAMLDRVPGGRARLADPSERRLLDTCAAAVRDVLDEPGDRLLHWDLHYDNVLAPLARTPAHSPERSPWLAIDPKPLSGDPGFELLPALRNRWDDVAGASDVSRAVRRRFHLMTEVLGLDRERAARWTLGRVLQNALWDIEDGAAGLQPEQIAIAGALPAQP